MAKVFVKNITKETRLIRPYATAGKTELKPGDTIECDRDWVEKGVVAAYPNFFRIEGGANPELADLLKFLEKATDAEKEAIAKALAPVPAKEAKKADKAPKA